jgi:hypothetical protein
MENGEYIAESVTIGVTDAVMNPLDYSDFQISSPGSFYAHPDYPMDFYAS